MGYFNLALAGILLAGATLWLGADPMIRHFAYMLTFGKVGRMATDVCDVEPMISSRFGKHKHCFDESGNIRYVDAHHNVSALRQLVARVLSEGCPVVIKHPFEDDQCMSRLTELADADSDVKVLAKTNTPSIMSAGNHWFPTSDVVLQTTQRKTEMLPLSDLLSEFRTGSSYKFTSFDSSLSGDFYAKVWKSDVTEWLPGGKMGSTFLSSYNETVVTAPMHSAFWDSFAYQCVGRKLWRMLTPDDLLPMMRFLHAFSVVKNCNNRQDLLDLTREVTTEPDSLFYFPPHWGHSVRTDSGTSVLLNYRMADVSTGRRLFNIHPLLPVHTGASVGMLKFIFPHLDPEAVTAYYDTGRMPSTHTRNKKIVVG